MIQDPFLSKISVAEESAEGTMPGEERTGLRLLLLSSEVHPASGWGRYTLEFCNALWRKGVDFELHLPCGARVPEVAFREAIRTDLPAWRSAIRWRAWRLLELRWAAYRIASQERIGPVPMIVHALVEYYGVLAYWLARNLGYPFGLTGYGTYVVRPLLLTPDRFWFRRVLRSADFLVLVSKYTAQEVRHISGLNNSHQVHVIHPGVSSFHLESSSRISTEEARQALGLPQKAPVLLSVGALKPRKGVDVLLRAFQRVLQDEPQAVLLLIGDGDRTGYQILAETLGIRERVRFLGSVDDELLARYYQACDVFVLLPRKIDKAFEGFGMVYLEAGAYGKPVVGTDSGGAGEAVCHGKTGLLVPEEDWAAAAQAILRLLRNPIEAQQLGEQGRRWAEAHQWDHIADRYLEIYVDVVREKFAT